jgi:hypothetical protein
MSTITPEGRLDLRCWCGASACYGEGVKLIKGELGKWTCRQHVPPGFLPAPSGTGGMAAPPAPPAAFATDRANANQWRLL